MLARSRKQETDLGRLLDPLADKLLLVGTFVPMYLLAPTFPFITPFGDVGLPLWVVVVVLGREVFMTLFRQAAKRRGVVIAAIGPAKWKTAVQLVWQGSAYFWFWAATLAALEGLEQRSLARVRAVQRHRRHADDGRRGRAHALLARALPAQLRQRVRDVFSTVTRSGDARRARHDRRRAPPRLHDRHQRRAPRARRSRPSACTSRDERQLATRRRKSRRLWARRSTAPAR